MIVFIFVGIFCRVSSNQVGESCDNNKGTCIDTTKQTCYNGDGILNPGYCAGSTNIICCEPPSSLPSYCLSNERQYPPRSSLYTLKNQGFPNKPGALVYVPSNFNSSIADGLEVVVYIHGYYNCIENIIFGNDFACNCSAGQAVRTTFDLINSFETVVTTRDTEEVSTNIKNYLFIAAEVAYDQANDSPGAWATEGVFKAYLDELFTQHLSPLLKTELTLNSIERIRIFSHSGGYYTIGNMAIVGGMSDKVYELCLLDSLYTNFNQFDTFVQQHLTQLGDSSKQFRFSSIYTSETYSNSQKMYDRVLGWLSASGLPAEVAYLNNDLTTVLTEQEIHKYPLIFKYSNFTHDETASYYFKLFMQVAK